MTRLERIKEMTIEEIATLLVQGDDECTYDLYGEGHNSMEDAIKANIEWLKEEAN